MNKYQSFSTKAQQARKRRAMCENKMAFINEQAARQTGQKHYLCPFCTQWHRSGALARLVAQVNRAR